MVRSEGYWTRRQWIGRSYSILRIETPKNRRTPALDHVTSLWESKITLRTPVDDRLGWFTRQRETIVLRGINLGRGMGDICTGTRCGWIVYGSLLVHPRGSTSMKSCINLVLTGRRLKYEVALHKPWFETVVPGSRIESRDYWVEWIIESIYA